MGAFKDLTGMRFGRLAVISGDRASGRYLYSCVCDCGTLTVVIARALTRTKQPTRSCGCLSADVSSELGKLRVVHGHARNGKRTRALNIWSNMIDRCTRSTNKSFHHYGARGIFVCDRWMSFDKWLLDMGDPKPKMTIERIDNNGPYSPENCRWATQKEQTRNTRRTRFVVLGGVSKSLAEWCEELGLNYFTVHNRITRLMKTPEEALK